MVHLLHGGILGASAPGLELREARLDLELVRVIVEGRELLLERRRSDLLAAADLRLLPTDALLEPGDLAESGP